MESLLYLELNVFSMLLLLIMFLKELRSADQQQENLDFRRVVLATMAVLACDALWTLVDGMGGRGMYVVNTVINVVYMILSCLISYLWVLFVENKLNKPRSVARWLKLVVAIPLLAVAVCSILSPWTHWIFYIDDQNFYHRGPLALLETFVCYGYLLAAGARSSVRALREQSHQKRAEARTLTTFIILPAIGGLLATIIYRLPATWPAVTLALFLVYIDFKNYQISTDGLTGLNNRRQLDKYLDNQAQEVFGNTRLYLLLMDINDFKKINDTYGHPEGDHALIAAASVMKQVCMKRDCLLARYGGDEFAIVCHSSERTDVERLCDEIHEAFAAYNGGAGKEYELSVSIGLAALEPTAGNAVARLLEQADAALYQYKHRWKTQQN